MYSHNLFFLCHHFEGADDFVYPIVLQEPHLKREIGFTVLDVVEEFMHDFDNALKDQNKEHMVTNISPAYLKED